MRKVFLEQNLGKKSKCRFPRRNQRLVVIKLMIAAQRAVSAPSLTQPLVISGVSVQEFCDRFNQETQNFEAGLPLRAKIYVNQATKTFDLQLDSPSVYKLMKRVFAQASAKINIFSQLVLNISLVKIITSKGPLYYNSDLRCFIKQVSGNLRSYDLRLNRNLEKKWRLISS